MTHRTSHRWWSRLRIRWIGYKYCRSMSHLEYIFSIYFWTFESREKRLAPFPKIDFRLSPQIIYLARFLSVRRWPHWSMDTHVRRALVLICTCPWRHLSLDDLLSHGMIWHRIYRTRALCLSDIFFILSHFITELFLLPKAFWKIF